MRIWKLFLLLLLPLTAAGQSVSIKIADNFVVIPRQQTQTETKPGWTIVDIKLKDKVTHYLYGGHSTQMADDRKPVFLIVPGQKEVLSDYIIIRLQNKKNYRKLPKSNLRENDYTRIEPSAFDLCSDGKDGFICKTRMEMEKGEYILLNISQKPVGEAQDLMVHPFRIP